MSKEESAALIWNKLPNELPQGYQKSQFQPSTGNAIYIENGKWEYNVYGEAITTRQLPINYLETTPGYWVENRSQEVTTRKLLLKTEYFENTGILNLPNVQVTSENTSTEILSQTPIDVFKLKLNWIRGVTDGYNLRLEGSVTNIGLFDLQDVVFEVTTYDFEGKFVRTDTITLTPSKIEVDQIATFSLSITGADLKQGPTGTPEQGNYGGYNYRFLTSTGQEITLQK